MQQSAGPGGKRTGAKWRNDVTNWEALREFEAGQENVRRFSRPDGSEGRMSLSHTDPLFAGRLLLEYKGGWEVQQEHCTFLDAVKKANGNWGQPWHRPSRPELRMHVNGSEHLILLEANGRGTSELRMCDIFATDWE